jgi:hypothetical protein
VGSVDARSRLIRAGLATAAQARAILVKLLRHLDTEQVALDGIYLLPQHSAAGEGTTPVPSGWGHRAACSSAAATQDYGRVFADFDIAAKDVRSRPLFLPCEFGPQLGVARFAWHALADWSIASSVLTSQVERRVLVVSTLNLDLEEVASREGPRLLYTPDSGSVPHFASQLPAPVDLASKFEGQAGSSVGLTASPGSRVVPSMPDTVLGARQLCNRRTSSAHGSDCSSVLTRGSARGSSGERCSQAVLPTVLLLPNPLAHPRFAALPMAGAVAAITALHSLSGWANGFDRLDERRLASLEYPLKTVVARRHQARRGDTKAGKHDGRAPQHWCKWRLHTGSGLAVWKVAEARSSGTADQVHTSAADNDDEDEPVYRVAVLGMSELEADAGLPKCARCCALILKCMCWMMTGYTHRAAIHSTLRTRDGVSVFCRYEPLSSLQAQARDAMPNPLPKAKNARYTKAAPFVPQPPTPVVPQPPTQQRSSAKVSPAYALATANKENAMSSGWNPCYKMECVLTLQLIYVPFACVRMVVGHMLIDGSCCALVADGRSRWVQVVCP